MVLYRKFALFMFLVSLPIIVAAQAVTYSAYDKFDFRSGEFAVAGISGGLLYNYRSTEDAYMLDAYDDSMNKVATVLLDFFPSKIYDVKFFTYPDKIIILYQALESNKVVQYAALLDQKGRLKNKPVELGSTKTGIFGATRTYFSSAISENKKLFFIYSANDKNSTIEVEGKWMDENLTIIKRSHANFKSDNIVEHGEVNIANDSTVYVAAFTPEGAENYADQYWFLKLKPCSLKFEPVELPLENKYAAGGYMKIDNNNNRIYFGGFYSDKKNGNYNGLIFACYDCTTSSYQSKKFIPFDADLILAAGARRQEHSFNNYMVKQLIMKKDGGFVLVSEIQYVTSRSTYNPAIGYYSFYSPYSTSTVREYHYNDIMALSYSKDGVREWSSIIPKEQYSQEDGGMFSSYTLLNSGGTLAFLFNDYNKAHSRIQLATIYADGKTNMHSFAPEGNEYPDWLPRSGKQVGGRVLIVPCLHKRQICFARVAF